MKHFKLLILLSALIFWTGCSSDDGDVDPILGSWAGEITQADLGLIEVSLSLATLEVGASGNVVSSEFNDISNCNNDLFYCDDILGTSCGSTWFFRSRSGNNYTFDEVTNPGNGCADGTIVANVSGDRLSYTFTDSDDSSNTSGGTLTRQ